MDLQELGAYLFQPGMRDLLRIETLDRYDSAGDRPHFARWLDTGRVELDDGWRAWLDRIGTDTRNGVTWRRVHVVTEPLNDYLRFELGVQYALNAEHGEQIRVLTPPPTSQARYCRDFFVVNGGDRVALSNYDATGKFVSADEAGSADKPVWIGRAADLWDAATPYAEWWAARPQYHGRGRAA